MAREKEGYREQRNIQPRIIEEGGKAMTDIEVIYISVSDAAKRYSLTRATMYQIMKLNEAPRTLKVGGKRLIPVKAFDDFMKKQFAS